VTPDPVESESGVGSLHKKLRLSLTDAELYGSLKIRKDDNVDEVTKYIRMAESDIGDDSNLLEWWATQVTDTILLYFQYFLSY